MQTCQFPTQRGDSDLGHGGREGGADTQEITPTAEDTCVQVFSARQALPPSPLRFPLSPIRPRISQAFLPGRRNHLPLLRSMAPVDPGALSPGRSGCRTRRRALFGAAPAASSSPPPDRMLAGRPRPALRAPGIDRSTPRPLRVSRSRTGQRHALLSPRPPAGLVGTASQPTRFGSVPAWPTCLHHSVFLALR